MQPLHLDFRRLHLGTMFDEVGLQFRHLDFDERLACGDDIPFVHGDLLDVTGHTGLEAHLLPWRETGGQGDPAMNGAFLRLRGRKFERQSAGGEEGEKQERFHDAV